MRRFLLTLAMTALLPATASATWSIIAIDLNTGRVAISSATCAATGQHQFKLRQAVVLPVAAGAAAFSVGRTEALRKARLSTVITARMPRSIR